MIVVDAASRLTVVTQPDHARLAADILSLWRRDGLPGHPRRAALLFATREHDNGWREADAAPRVDPASGRPHDFRSLPEAPRREIWRRGVRRFREERPDAALLIARHAAELHRNRRDRPEWTEFFVELDELTEELAAGVDADAATLEADYRLLDLADTLSLAICNRWTEPFERGGYRLAPDGPAWRLDPFPLAGSTTFRYSCRHLPRSRFAGDADLGGELAAAVWQEAAVRLVPW